MFQAERCYRCRLVEPQEAVELLRQRSLGIVAHQFGLRPIDDADEAFEALPPERAHCGAVARQISQETLDAGIMELTFVAVPMGGIDALDFAVAVPVGGRRDRAGMGTHANQRYVVFSKPFPAELTDVE